LEVAHRCKPVAISPPELHAAVDSAGDRHQPDIKLPERNGSNRHIALVALEITNRREPVSISLPKPQRTAVDANL
jgi:hypothetical protein